MQKVATVLFLIAATGAVGCAHRHDPPRQAQRARPVESRAEWAKLGERWVDGTRDRDVISLRDADRRFRRIMIVVEDSALEMFDVVVTFADGTRYSPPTRHVFAANTRSHVIDLPGSERSIRSVEFRYGNLPGGGRAQAELWAQ
jgi:hypothetical protein